MHPRHRGDYAETEAVARRATAFLRTIEAPEDEIALIHGNPGSVVGNRKDGAAVAAIGADPYEALLAPMFDRVVHQIGDRIKEKVPVSKDFNRFPSAYLQSAASLLRGGVKEFSHLLRD